MSSTQRAVKGSLGTVDPKVRILNLSNRWSDLDSVVCCVRSLRAGRLSNRGSTAGRNKKFSSQLFRPTGGPNSVLYSVDTGSAFAREQSNRDVRLITLLQQPPKL
jgi:hypothetical protein